MDGGSITFFLSMCAMMSHSVIISLSNRSRQVIVLSVIIVVQYSFFRLVIICISNRSRATFIFFGTKSYFTE
jgi:hypothetical protein